MACQDIFTSLGLNANFPEDLVAFVRESSTEDHLLHTLTTDQKTLHRFVLEIVRSDLTTPLQGRLIQRLKVEDDLEESVMTAAKKVVNCLRNHNLIFPGVEPTIIFKNQDDPKKMIDAHSSILALQSFHWRMVFNTLFKEKEEQVSIIDIDPDQFCVIQDHIHLFYDSDEKRQTFVNESSIEDLCQLLKSFDFSHIEGLTDMIDLKFCTHWLELEGTDLNEIDQWILFAHNYDLKQFKKLGLFIKRMFKSGETLESIYQKLSDEQQSNEIAYKCTWNELFEWGFLSLMFSKSCQNRIKKLCQISESQPREIMQIMESELMSIQQMKTLKTWKKSRDILVVWNRISRTIHQNFPDWNREDLKQTNELSKQFSAWLEINSNLLTSLQGLFLDKNQLTTLPIEIGQLTNLRRLNIGHNQLTILPVEIEQLTDLVLDGWSDPTGWLEKLKRIFWYEL